MYSTTLRALPGFILWMILFIVERSGRILDQRRLLVSVSVIWYAGFLGKAESSFRTTSGDTDRAISTYKRGHDIAPDSLSVLSGYVGLLKSAKKLPEALAVLRTAVDRDPRNSSVKRDLIHVEAKIGGLEVGLATARDFAQSDPENSLYDVVSAELYEKAGRGEEARAIGPSEIADLSFVSSTHFLLAAIGIQNDRMEFTSRSPSWRKFAGRAGKRRVDGTSFQRYRHER